MVSIVIAARTDGIGTDAPFCKQVLEMLKIVPRAAYDPAAYAVVFEGDDNPVNWHILKYDNIYQRDEQKEIEEAHLAYSCMFLTPQRDFDVIIEWRYYRFGVHHTSSPRPAGRTEKRGEGERSTNTPPYLCGRPDP